MISRKWFYYLSLSLPIFMPFVMSDYWHYPEDEDVLYAGKEPPVRYYLSQYTFGVGLFGFVPYCILAGCLIFWMRKNTPKQIAHAMWKWPLATIPVSLVVSILFIVPTFFAPSLFPALYNQLILFTELSVFFVLYAYFYVVLVKVLEWVLTKCRVFKSEAV